ncbi:MAG: trimethylamine methyltransferase family protein [Thermodesulfobacteriota bacterium]|nr:trimethylamine methyltransferase family protein [Thermodesulfobacteriota bacterium]
MAEYKYNPLSEAEIVLIHNKALKVLENIGIKVKSSSAYEIFKHNSARCHGDIVNIPRAMVKDALQSTPSEVILYGRDEKHNLYLGGREPHLGTGGAALNVIDTYNQKPRRAALKDIAQIAKLVEHLQYIEFYLRPVVAQDIPEESVDVNKYYASLMNTTKHIMGSVGSIEHFHQLKEMGSIIAGSFESFRSKPFLSFITCWMSSPLSIDTKTTKILIEILKQKLPVVLSSAPMAGSTAPVTLAGCLVQLHAEILSGVVLTQLVNPGTPVIYGYVPSIANPITMDYLGGSAEFGLLNAAAVQIAAYFNLPNYCSAGLTDAKIPDAQAGIEKALSILQVAQAGGNYIHHAAGMLESMLTVSYAQYVIDNDILGMVTRILRGIEVNDSSMAYDVIAKVGQGGNYLSEKHTAKSLRKEYFFPKVMDRNPRRKWQTEGAKDLWKTSNEKAKSILAMDVPPKISEEAISEIKKHIQGIIL